MKRFLLSIFAIGVMSLSATFTASAADKIRVVVSFSILKDLVEQIGRDAVVVETIIPNNAEPHSFEYTPDSIRKLLNSQLFVINGLGFEPWADKLLRASNYQGQKLVASKGIKALPLRSHGGYDPHAWQDVENVILYVKNIADALAEVQPEKQDYFKSNEAAYSSQLKRLHETITLTFQNIPESQRRAATNHEAFTYYGDAYGITFYGMKVSPVIAEDAKSLSSLIQKLKADRVRAIFLEGVDASRLASQVSKETGIKIGGTLISDTLYDGKKTVTYLEMMRSNTKTIADALR